MPCSEIYRKYGYFRESVLSLTLEGREGVERIRNAVAALRSDPPAEIGGYAFTGFADYACGIQKDLLSGREQSIHLPASDVLAFTFPAGRIVVRPSGTEPKLKAYLAVEGCDMADAQSRLDALSGEVSALLHRLCG